MNKGNDVFVKMKEEYVWINGIEHYLYHRGNKKENPVMLFLHGGPGSVESIFAHLFQDKWEDEFTVVHWDQRGAGKTLLKNKKSFPTVEQLLTDVHEVIHYLKISYQVNQVVLLGHSWGSVLGSLYIQKHPENVAYYIGVGQVINMLENERVGYEKLKQVILDKNDMKSLKKLEAIGEYPGDMINFNMYSNIGRVRSLQTKHQLAVGPSWSLVKQVMKSPVFKYSDAFAMMYGIKANEKIINFLGTFGLDHELATYQVPVYYILGMNDWQTPYPLAATYFDHIKAPHKKLYLIPDAGHMTMMDQEALFFEALVEIKNQLKE